MWVVRKINVNIDNKYLLVSDEHQFIIRKLRPNKEFTLKNKKGDKSYSNFTTASYHSNIDGALRAILNNEVLESTATTLKELRRDMKNAIQYVTEIGNQLKL